MKTKLYYREKDGEVAIIMTTRKLKDKSSCTKIETIHELKNIYNTLGITSVSIYALEFDQNKISHIITSLVTNGRSCQIYCAKSDEHNVMDALQIYKGYQPTSRKITEQQNKRVQLSYIHFQNTLNTLDNTTELASIDHSLLQSDIKPILELFLHTPQYTKIVCTSVITSVSAIAITGLSLYLDKYVSGSAGIAFGASTGSLLAIISISFIGSEIFQNYKLSKQLQEAESKASPEHLSAL